jgi:hypothetical protein
MVITAEKRRAPIANGSWYVGNSCAEYARISGPLYRSVGR